MADKVQTQLPTDEQALEFAVMLKSGLPAAQAIQYFVDVDTADEVAAWARRWAGCRAVGDALSKLQKKRFQDMTLQEKMDTAMEMHYAQLAYLLFSANYVEAAQPDKVKMDDARKAIEAKLAGTAGQVGAMEMFYADLRAGRVKLNTEKASVKVPTVVN